MDSAIVASIVGGFAVTLGTLIVMHFQNRKATIEMLDLLRYTLTQFPPHSHSESEGETLTEKGIHYPRDFKLRK